MKFVLLFMASLFFFCCCSDIKKLNSISFSDNIPLMTYHNYYDEEDMIYSALGYVNTETFEIVIPAQYDAALPFVGNFAIVQDFNDKKYVINKKNEKLYSIKSNIDTVRIYKMEKSDTVLLLTIKYSGIASIEGFGLFDRGLVIIPSRISVKIYNLYTGKQILKVNSKHPYWAKPEILLVNDYVIYQTEMSDYDSDNDEFINTGTHVYKMNDDGKLDACTITAEELIMQIAEERNMVPKDFETSIDRSSGIKWFYNNTKSFTYCNPHSSIFGPYFGFIDRIDSDVFIKNLPENMQLRNYAFTMDKFPEGTRIEDLEAAMYSVENIVDKHEYDMYPINRKKEYPLQEDFSLYGVVLEDKHSIYDALENKWVIDPIEDNIFYSTHYENYIGNYIFEHEGNIFYNIRTRKKYTNLFHEQKNYYTFPYLIYEGHYINEFEKRENKKYMDGKWSIEDF